MKNIYKKTLAYGIFILFVGMMIVPTMNAISPQNKEKEIIELPSKSISGNNGDYDLLIITPKKFAHILNPLLKHKERVGVNTKLTTLNEIYEEETGGRDKAEKIKFYIKDAYDMWSIKYVLLIGGFTVIGSTGLAMCVISAFFDAWPIPPLKGKTILNHSKILWATLFTATLVLYGSWLLLL